MKYPVGTAGKSNRSLARGARCSALAMLGLAQALYGPKDEDQVIIVEGAEPEDDEPFNRRWVELCLRRSRPVVRKSW